MKFKSGLNAKTVVMISVIIAVIMFASSYNELNQSKKEIFHLLYEQSSALIESIIQSSRNTLNSSFEIEDMVADRLLDNARLIQKLDAAGKLSVNELISIGRKNNLFRINIFDRKGNRVLSNRIPEPGHIHGEENINRSEELDPILSGETDELVIGLKNAEFADGERYAVAVARENSRGAIVVNLDAKDFLEFRKKIGIGKILQEMTKHHRIEYIVLQDTFGILAASQDIDSMEAIRDSDFLFTALRTDSTLSRISSFHQAEIFEVVKPFIMNDETVGLYRIGISLEDIRNVEDRMIQRLIIISIILAAISIIVLSIIFTAQNLRTISDEYGKFKTLTSSVLENMDEAVIVLDSSKNINLFNKASCSLFNIRQENARGINLFKLNNNLLNLSEGDISNPRFFEREILSGNNIKYLLIGTSAIKQENKIENYILVIKDITEIKNLELENIKNEKLTAMGELASGVAHEIRNPINAIGMIAQRLNKEFSVTGHQDEYNEITHLLSSEVKRINRIISQFLDYAKTIDINPKAVNLNSYFTEIKHLFEEQAKRKEIDFIIKGDGIENFIFDPDLIKQALMNIIQNAFEAVDRGDTVKVNYGIQYNKFFIEISDSGPGIPADMQKRIFDLYFTTKKDGNGLGLSIAQKIISQHKGSIGISSVNDKGTTFKILLPEA